MPRQTNFLGGEIAPMNWGRNDRPFYGRGARTLRNFVPTRAHGAAVSRPGSLYIGQTRDNNDTARLLPFVYADDNSFCIEMGITPTQNVYFRFYTGGVQLTGTYLHCAAATPGLLAGDYVTGATSGATARVLFVHPDRLQVANVFGNFTPGETINGLAAGSKVVTTGTIETEPLEVLGGTVTAAFDIMKVKYAQLGAILVLTHPDWPAQELRRLDDVGGQKRFTFGNWSFSPPAPYFALASVGGTYPVLGTVIAPGPTTPNREWAYIVTLTVQDWETGRIFETTGWRITEQWDGILADAPTTFFPDDLAIYIDSPLQILRGLHIDGPAGGANVPNTTYRVITANYYRGRGNLFGFVDSSDWIEFIDVGKEPDYFSPPPYGTHPFKVTKEDGTIVYEHPVAVAFHQNRLGFAGTPRRPCTVFTSASGVFDNWDLNTIVHTAGEALVYELAARKFEQVVHLLSHHRLLVGTKSSVWMMSGAQGGVLDFDSVDARVVDEVGMTDLAPIIVDGKVLFVRTKGKGVRALQFDAREGVYAGAGISEHSDHLFTGKTVMPVSGAAVAKQIIDWTYAEDPFGLVWAVRADGMLLSLTVAEDGAFAWARHDGLPTTWFGIDSPPQYRRVCAVPETDDDGVYVIVKRFLNNTPVNCVERMTSRERSGTAYDDCCLDSAVLVNQAVPSRTITGLDHLEGEAVWMCGVGNAPQGPYTVVGGEITLGTMPVVNFQTFRCLLYVGRSFYADLELLDLISADARLKQKAVTRIGLEVDQSQGVLVGEVFTALVSTRANTVDAGYNSPDPETQLLNVTPTRKWGTGGRACLRQTLPLPITVVGVVRDLEVGG